MNETEPETKFRISPRATLKKIANVTQEAIDLVHGVAAAASLTRGRKSMMSVYASHNEEQYIGIDQAIDLQIAGKHVLFLELLAEEAGYSLIKHADIGEASQWGVEFIDVVKTTTDALNKITTALEDDGDISNDEIEALKLRKVIARAMQKLACIDKHLAQVEIDAEK
ncbi:MAG: hypothetical protein HRU28_05495 [Rhizobiales bacterium]|nr:hypothetical protein [Hyphomicrobiales bacterium]